MVFTCTVMGVAQPQPRPRRAKHGGVYTPKTATAWKQKIIRAVQAVDGFPPEPLTGPLFCSLAFYLPRPKYMQAKKYSDFLIWKPTRPDADNYEKAVWDALTNAGLWVDDAQVCQWQGVKNYCGKGGLPSVDICVMVLEQAKGG